MSAEPSSYFPVAFVAVIALAFGALVVLSTAPRVDTAPAAHPLPTRCDVPAAQGDRLVVTFTRRGEVIDINCRPIKAARS